MNHWKTKCDGGCAAPRRERRPGQGGMRMGTKLTIAAFASLVIGGCTNIGPHTIPRDRFDYNAAISDSWKEQTLLNVVKLRYADMPLFVEVASVVSGYTLEGAVSLGAETGGSVSDLFSLGTAAKYTDRPTITYVPITGKRFNVSFMTPIPPDAIIFLMQSGWAVDLILPLTVDSISGLRARVAAGAGKRAGDPKFYRVIALLRAIQQSGAVGMRVVASKENERSTVLFFYRDQLTPELKAALQELDTLLGLDPTKNEFTVTYGLLPGSKTEIAMLTRSILQIMIVLAAEVDVPIEHVKEGRTVASLSQPGSASTPVQARLINIKYKVERPKEAFAAVRYRDHWFYIDDRDFLSKRIFAFLMVLFSLTETGGREGLPLVTIPAG